MTTRSGDRRFLAQFKDANVIRLIFVTIIVFVIMSLLRPQLFLTARNFRSMGYQLAELGFYSMAMMMTMVSGGIDLSIIAISNFSGIAAAFILRAAALNGAAGFTLLLYGLLAVGVALLIGILCGLLNGLIISRLRIPAMLVTLGTMNLFTGLAIILTKGKSVSGFPSQVLYLGNNTLLGLPIPLWFLIGGLIVTSILLERTSYGFELKFVGQNPIASLFTGMNNEKILAKTYVYSGILSAIVGLIVLTRTNSAKADFGQNYLFQAILCSVLGATNPDGGYGKVTCLTLALISLQFLSSGFNMLRLGGYHKEFAWGVLLLAVLTYNFIRERRMQRTGAARAKS
ncbi:MAG: ABC transporter permease [Firmicutes bacterium]|jgi:simple sugar transport system permease protein|nr:ABC transporter permease [Bacillota bacterium]NLJ02547.1 ABC transporter permease [Bacillota bacterium]NLM53352.1 ABC transporter permease [Bacillota bacterium]